LIADSAVWDSHGVRQLAAISAVIASLAVAGCGHDDDDTPGAPVYDPTPTYETTPTPAEGCSESHPRRVSEPSEFTGYIVLCDEEGGTSMTIDNISDVAVVDIKPNGQTWDAQDVTPAPEPRFAQQLTVRITKPGCDGSSCIVPAGTTLQLDAAEPVRAIVEVRMVDTFAAVVAASVLDQINARLGTPGQRFADRALTCGKNAAELLNGASSWEQAFRDGLEASSCATLARELDEGDPAARPGVVNRILARAKQYAGGSINDLLLLAAKLAAPG